MRGGVERKRLAGFRSRSGSEKEKKKLRVTPVRLPGPRGELAVVLSEPAARVDGEAVAVFFVREEEDRKRKDRG